MTTFNVTLRVLSPVFIGDGNDLRKGADFDIYNGHTYRFNQDTLFEAKWEELEAGFRNHRRWNYLKLAPADFNNDAYFRYVIRGVPRATQNYTELKSCIKDVFDRPYIPGSSLKGALRTALAWTGWEEANQKFDLSRLGRSRSWAAQPIEREIFGRDPNHDLLRALQVSDLHGPQKPGGGLAVVNAQVFTAKAQQSPIELEAIVGDVRFSGTLTIEDALFTPWAERELPNFRQRKPWFDELMLRTQRYSAARIAELSEHFNYIENATGVAKFYRQLAEAGLPENAALLQIGWGAGWDGKTFFTHLKKDARQFDRLIDQYRLQRRSKQAPPRRSGDRFPTSRRVALRNGQGVAPFGWVLMTMTPKEG